MVWNPEIYSEYKDLRSKPVFDLLRLIDKRTGINGIDLGCGTGEQTAILQDALPESSILGIDSSKEMLAQSPLFGRPGITFRWQEVQDVLADKKQYDLVFSNAALQWLDRHDILFPKIVQLIAPAGQLAIQMPVQHENILNRILASLASSEPYAAMLKGYVQKSSVLSIDEYTQLLFACGLQDIHVSVRVYPLIAAAPADLYNFVAGSALQPYLERLSMHEKEAFIDDFKLRIEAAFPVFPAIYPFKRILLYARRA